MIGVANSGVNVAMPTLFLAFSSNLTACINMCGCTHPSCYMNDHVALFDSVMFIEMKCISEK